jgi:hypothetical protein
LQSQQQKDKGCLQVFSIHCGHIDTISTRVIHQEQQMQEKITFQNRKSQALAGVLHMPASGQPHACAGPPHPGK